MWKIGELRKIMARYGDANKEIWQTERAIGGVYAGFFCGGAQAVRITMQRDLLEIFGVTNDHNSHYYANVTGYNDVPTFVYSGSGPHPAALACRTRYAMTVVGRKFSKQLDLGPTGNKLFLALLYEGPAGSTVTLRNFGAADQTMELDVSGGNTLEVVDSFGNSEQVPVRGGKAKVTVPIMPVYVKLKSGQRLSTPKIDFGQNFAREARFAYSGGTKSPESILTDGLFQVFHNQNPWGQNWGGSYAGRKFNETPQTLDIAFGAARQIGGLIIYTQLADNPHCALLDYDLQYNNSGKWTTIEEVRTPCPPSDAIQTELCKVTTWYMDHNLFIHRFDSPITTDKLRLVVRRISRGCFIDYITEDTLGWRPSAQTLEIREIEVYGPLPSRFALGAAASGGSGTAASLQDAAAEGQDIEDVAAQALEAALKLMFQDAVKGYRALRRVQKRFSGTTAAKWAETEADKLYAEHGAEIDAQPEDSGPVAGPDALLRMAKNFIQNRQYQSARDKLNELLSRYPDSKEAADARALLWEIYRQ